LVSKNKKEHAVTQTVPRGRCIAIIGDIIGSRGLGPQRSNAQKQLFSSLAEINRKYRNGILSTFTVTVGDEFQGLVSRAEFIPNLIWDLENHLNYSIRLGIGCGRLSTQLQPSAIGMDGPVWHAAREAIQDSYKNGKYGGVFKNFSERDDPILNGFARILYAERQRFTEKQLTVLNLLRNNLSQVEVAARLRVSKQAISRHVLTAGWSAYEEARDGWETALRPYDFSNQWNI